MTPEHGPWDEFAPSNTLISCIARSYRKRTLKEAVQQDGLERIGLFLKQMLWRFCSLTIASEILEKQNDPVGKTFILTKTEGTLDRLVLKALIQRTGCAREEIEVFEKEIVQALFSLARDGKYASSWWRLEIKDAQVVVCLTRLRKKETPPQNKKWVKATPRKFTKQD